MNKFQRRKYAETPVGAEAHQPPTESDVYFRSSVIALKLVSQFMDFVLVSKTIFYTKKRFFKG
ncbi:hypothetical protein GCM10009001_31130 [Virgibacillus siamensis]|uniref:Uncharacterized protein n=1 Tax=Virgibacillus siamensis TaxID=480071 RepID=A0ABP3RJH2_9BACI